MDWKLFIKLMAQMFIIVWFVLLLSFIFLELLR
jgi:hypothetical protein